MKTMRTITVRNMRNRNKIVSTSSVFIYMYYCFSPTYLPSFPPLHVDRVWHGLITFNQGVLVALLGQLIIASSCKNTLTTIPCLPHLFLKA